MILAADYDRRILRLPYDRIDGPAAALDNRVVEVDNRADTGPTVGKVYLVDKLCSGWVTE